MPHDPLPSPEACPDVNRLAAWCLDRIAGDERDALDVHIASCPICAELVADLQPAHLLPANLGAIAPARVIERAFTLVPARPTWRFIASGMAAAIAFAALGCWMGYRLATQSTSTGVDGDASRSNLVASSSGTNSFGIIDDASDATESSADPFELLAARLMEKNAS